jgi:hypothetical protein
LACVSRFSLAGCVATEQKLQELDTQQARLREMLLRIDGAMHVLREMLAADGDTTGTVEDATGEQLSAAASSNGGSSRTVAQ